ncbi:MAG: TIGR03032 family protein [Gemmataceae bacterium]|nr:TIGR03032 family protein [Gemmataceae bacterium]
MELPVVLVSAHDSRGVGHLLRVDLNNETYQPLLPYAGSICTTPEHLFIARQEGDRTRLEKYDRDGLVWMRRVARCFDTHSLTPVGSQIAVCSTGTNQVIYLDESGAELHRWAPEGANEPDAWHLNSLSAHEGRLFATCFGRFAQFRGWASRIAGAGLLLEPESGQVVVEGLAAPHDPRRVDDGWLVNDSARSRLLFYPDEGPEQVVIESPGFSRGLAVLPKHLVVGFSSPRCQERQQKCASLLLVERGSHRLVKSINVPYAEIGHIFEAPDDRVLQAIQDEQALDRRGLLHERTIIATADRAGGITALSPLRPSERPGVFDVHVRVANDGAATWASSNQPPIHISYQVLSTRGDAIFPEGLRTRLPMPLLPGQTLTFSLAIDLTMCGHLAGPAAVRITLVQESVAWWGASDCWTPAVLPLPAGMVRASTRRPGRWMAKLGLKSSI